MGNSDNPIHHSPNAARVGDNHQHSDLARKGAPKNLADVRIHSGMVTRSRATGNYHFGGDDLSRFDADPASPLKAPPSPKRLSAPQPVPGHRSRTNGGMSPDEFRDLGRRVLAEATCSPDERMALPHYFGALPDSTVDDSSRPCASPARNT